MRRTILTILGSALLAALTVQIAAAVEHDKDQKTLRAPAPVTQDFRSSNAYWQHLSPADVATASPVDDSHRPGPARGGAFDLDREA
jgi:hypothetical protein